MFSPVVNSDLDTESERAANESDERVMLVAGMGLLLAVIGIPLLIWGHGDAERAEQRAAEIAAESAASETFVTDELTARGLVVESASCNYHACEVVVGGTVRQVKVIEGADGEKAAGFVDEKQAKADAVRNEIARRWN